MSNEKCVNCGNGTLKEIENTKDNVYYKCDSCGHLIKVNKNHPYYRKSYLQHNDKEENDNCMC